MISKTERFTYVGEFRLYTYRNYFENSVPIMSALVKDMETKIAAGQTYTLKAGAQTLKLCEMHLGTAGYAEFLFRLTNPDIPDNELEDRANGSLRHETSARIQQYQLMS